VTTKRGLSYGECRYAYKAEVVCAQGMMGIFRHQPTSDGPSGFRPLLQQSQVCREKAISAVVAILQPQNRSNMKSISNDEDLFT
jgi:hypothetical protein